MSQVMTRTSRAFRARVLGKVRQTEGEVGALGEADILVAVFDVADTEPAVGNEERQVIDRGAFRTWIEARDDAEPVLFLRDHGNAHMTGFVDSGLSLGFADNFRETDEGLVYTGHYNLATQEGADAFERLRFSPGTTQFSFRWDGDEVEERDGVQHVVSFGTIEEVSQVGFGAQTATKPLGWRTGEVAEVEVEVRAPIASHSTSTSEASWDGPANEARLSSDASPETLRSAHGWADPEGDPEAKATYKFIHHEVSSDGSVGAANLTACSSSIAILNGGRGGANIPDADRPGVHAHMARHLRDGDREVPELRAQGPEDEEPVESEPETEPEGEREPEPDGEEVRAGGEHDPLPSRGTVRQWVKHESFRKMVEEELDSFRSDDEGDRAAEGEETDARSVAAQELRALYSTLYQRT